MGRCFLIIITSTSKGGVNGWFEPGRDEWQYYWGFPDPEDKPIAFRKADDNSVEYFHRIPEIPEMKGSDASILWLCGYRSEEWSTDLSRAIRSCIEPRSIFISLHPTAFPDEVERAVAKQGIRANSYGLRQRQNYVSMMQERKGWPPIFDTSVGIEIIREVFF